METKLRIAQEKLLLDIELINIENSQSYCQILIGVTSILNGLEAAESTQRILNFLTYELLALVDDVNEQDRYLILNDYFFVKKGFQNIAPLDGYPNEKIFLLETLFKEKSAHPLVVSLFYMHLASQLDLPLFLVNLPGFSTIKWARGSHCNYLDLNNNGRILEDQDIAAMLARNNKETIVTKNDLFEILTSKKIIFKYFSCLSEQFESINWSEKILIMYNLILSMEPANLKYLARRSLLYKEMGLNKEAMLDLKRYFSFVDKRQASPELQLAFVELQQSSIQFSDLIH